MKSSVVAKLETLTVPAYALGEPEKNPLFFDSHLTVIDRYLSIAVYAAEKQLLGDIHFTLQAGF